MQLVTDFILSNLRAKSNWKVKNVGKRLIRQVHNDAKTKTQNYSAQEIKVQGRRRAPFVDMNCTSSVQVKYVNEITCFLTCENMK